MSELTDAAHPARAVAHHQREWFAERFLEWTKAMGVKDPKATARVTPSVARHGGSDEARKTAEQPEIRATRTPGDARSGAAIAKVPER